MTSSIRLRVFVAALPGAATVAPLVAAPSPALAVAGLGTCHEPQAGSGMGRGDDAVVFD